MLKIISGLTVMATLALTPGCDILGVSCSKEGRFGIDIGAIDSISGDPISADLVLTAVAVDGTYADTVRFDGNGRIGMASERTGTYVVQVTAEGYHPWRQEDVRVSRTNDGCNKVDTVSITARLRPL